jgi:hypothetical protein
MRIAQRSMELEQLGALVAVMRVLRRQQIKGGSDRLEIDDCHPDRSMLPSTSFV